MAEIIPLSDGSRIAQGGGGPHDPDMGDRLDALEGRLGRFEATLEGMRHTQNIGLGVVGLFVAIVGLLVTIGISEVQNLNSSVSATNVRLDHQLEQQATSASQQAAAASASQAAANARMDRLLELYAQQVHGQPPAVQQPAPAPGK